LTKWFSYVQLGYCRSFAFRI